MFKHSDCQPDGIIEGERTLGVIFIGFYYLIYFDMNITYRQSGRREKRTSAAET